MCIIALYFTVSVLERKSEVFHDTSQGAVFDNVWINTDVSVFQSIIIIYQFKCHCIATILNFTP